jgi:succinyl-diaminopimelate desuccinylase
MVPDAPTPDGDMIEVSEKSILWMKAVIEGVQCHGSTPGKGINAHKAGAKFITAVADSIYQKFDRRDNLFSPPISTFEVTKKEANVPNINVIPGQDVIYFDNRILPGYDVDKVMNFYKEHAKKVEAETGAKIKFETVMLDKAAPPTSPDSEVVKLTEECVKLVYKNKPFPGGIGGGTYAAMFRRAGFDAVVWCKGDELAHQYNEYCIIDNLVGDAKVFAAMAMKKK